MQFTDVTANAGAGEKDTLATHAIIYRLVNSRTFANCDCFAMSENNVNIGTRCSRLFELRHKLSQPILQTTISILNSRKKFIKFHRERSKNNVTFSISADKNVILTLQWLPTHR